MAANSKIEWTDQTWNPVVGCSIVSPGCTNCYAMRMARRLDGTVRHYAGTTKSVNGNIVWTGKVALAPEVALTAPLRWRSPRMVFVNSMGDLFHESVPDEWIDRVFAIMALCPQHTFQVLTKRAERMRAYINRARCRNDVELAAERFGPSVGFPVSPKWCFEWPLPNVWLGVSCERQQEADERIPELLQTRAAVRFVSCEPLLGPIDLRRVNGSIDALEGSATFPPLDWVITGGESGPNARSMNPQWARDIRDHCELSGVAFFHKQNGEFASVSEVAGPGRHHTFPDHRTVRRVGKKAAGRLLDGKEWNQFPTIKRTQPASAPVPSDINPNTG